MAAVLLVWLACIDGGPIGLGAACPPVVPVPPVARLRDPADGTSRPCRSGLSGTRVQHRDRTPPGTGLPRHPAISDGRMHAGCRRYRIRRVHARRHRYQAGRHVSDIDSGPLGTRGLPISIPRPACRYRRGASRALISAIGPAGIPVCAISTACLPQLRARVRTTEGRSRVDLIPAVFPDLHRTISG